ncbi:hypothetical protein QL093DRAFT_2591472 [Fusarium oxysporum]|nr:hypothetical protein QL093DRAFT_2591472 [Fusarium oxysporum]
MTLLSKPSISMEDIRNTIDTYIKGLSDELYTLNKQIHDEPEIAFQEFKAQTHISDFLEQQGHSVQRGAYNLPTSLESIYGSQRPMPSVATYLALTHTLRKYGIDGRAHHPFVEDQFRPNGTIGSAGQSSIAIVDLIAEFRGTSAHASGNPWDGINALDALVASYNNISMLRQQIKPDERIHGCILQAPKITNAIPEYTKVKFSIRSPKMNSLKKLGQRVRHCLEAGGLATGCEVEITEDLAYADLWVNDPLCSLFKQHMDLLGVPLSQGSQSENIVVRLIWGMLARLSLACMRLSGSKHQRARSHTIMLLQRLLVRRDAHLRILEAAKGMALTAWSAIVDDKVFAEIQDHFDKMRKTDENLGL